MNSEWAYDVNSSTASAMMKSVIVWIYVTYLCYLLQPFCTGTTYTSKVCYGSDPHCTQHHLSCNSTQKIAIHDAYYTNNSNCTLDGISSCVNFSADGVTEYGYHRFNNAELVSLYEHCSTKVQCVYRAPRRSAALAFSVVKYRCIEENIPESPKITSTHNSLAPGTTDNNNTVAGEAVNNTGAIVGGVVATVVAVLVVTLVSVWFLRYRRTKSEVKDKPAPVSTDVKPDMAYSLARKIPQENYHEIKDVRTHNNGYDYATADGVNLPLTTDNYFTIEPVGKLTVTANSMACTTESDYDHIGDKPTPPTSDYDTTASVAQQGHITEDSYGYNHFQNKVNSQTHQNDYDTAASATKAVASISTAEKKTAEDDYDHFHKATNAAKTVSSPYDTTSRVEDNSDYFVAGQME